MANNYINGLLGDPTFMIGASLLGHKGDLNKGLLQGMRLSSGYRNQLLQEQQNRLKLEALQRQNRLGGLREQARGRPGVPMNFNLNAPRNPWEALASKGWDSPEAQAVAPRMDTGMYSSDPKELARARQLMAASSADPLAEYRAQAAEKRTAEMHPIDMRYKNAIAAASLRGPVGTPTKAQKLLAARDQEIPNSAKWNYFNDLMNKERTITGTTEFDPAALTKSQLGNEVISARDLDDGIKEGDVLIDNLNTVTTPFAAKTRSTVAGVVGALGDVTNADALHDAAESISPRALEAFRTNAILWTRGQRRMIDDGKMSDQDAAALNEAFGVLNTARSKRQMVNAIRNVQEIMRRKRETKFGQALKPANPAIKRGEGETWTEGGVLHRYSNGKVQVWKED